MYEYLRKYTEEPDLLDRPVSSYKETEIPNKSSKRKATNTIQNGLKLPHDSAIASLYAADVLKKVTASS